MDVVRTSRYSKRDPAMRWALPDRVFFACGACHVLAHAFHDRYGPDGRRRPGDHVFVDGGRWAFDVHG